MAENGRAQGFVVLSPLVTVWIKAIILCVWLLGQFVDYVSRGESERVLSTNG